MRMINLFLTGERSPEGFYYVKQGIEQAISRGLAYAPYSDLIWCETATPNLEEAKKFADAIHEKFPGKLLAYNCSPSFNWKKHLSDAEIATFQQKIVRWVINFNSLLSRVSTLKTLQFLNLQKNTKLKV